MNTSAQTPSPAQVRQFGFILLCGFVLAGVAIRQLRTHDEHSIWHYSPALLFAAGLLVAAVCIFRIGLGARLYSGWMRMGAAFGALTSTILLVVMYLTIVPLFAAIRLKDPLRLRPARPEASLWGDPKVHVPTVERMRRPF